MGKIDSAYVDINKRYSNAKKETIENAIKLVEKQLSEKENETD